MSIASEIAGDVRFAVRTLGRSPFLTTVAVVTVALGIGATTVVFGVVNAVLLRPLPYAEPDRLVKIIENVPAEETRSGLAVRRSSMTQEDFDAFRARSQSFSHLVMTMGENAALNSDSGSALLAGARVTPALFPMRGIAPLLGRGLTAEEERPDADVVVVSEETWRRYLAADPNVIGRLVMLDGQLREIVGVMPAEFGSEAFWRPLYLPPAEPGRTIFAPITARLRVGVSIEEASAEVNVLGGQLRMAPTDADASARFELIRELDQAVAPIVPALRVLVFAVGIVLLIVCTNIANLMLAKGIRRQNEIAIRTSLGASRARIARQVLTECMVLAGFAGLAGVVLAYGGVELLKALAGVSLADGNSASQSILPRIEEVSIDPVVVVFAACLSVGTGALIGAFPSLRLSRFSESVRTSGVQNLATPRSMRAGSVVATAQIGLAMTLLVGAGLLLSSFLKLATVDVGFNPLSTLSFDLVVPGDYSAARKLQVAEDIAIRLGSDNRVLSAGYTDSAPLQPFVTIYSQFTPEGYTPAEIAEEQDGLPGNERTQSRFVSPGYLEALGARLVSGAWLEGRQSPQTGISVLVSQPFAERYFAQADPVGRSIQSSWGPLSIVGVVDGINMMGIDREPERIVFLDPRDVVGKPPISDGTFLTLGPRGTIPFAVRTLSDPLSVVSTVRAVVEEADPRLGLSSVRPMEQIRSEISTRPRFFAVLLLVFAAIAAFIAIIGVYGVLTYVVGQRTKEIGVRIALGATRGEVLSLILRRGALIVLLGIGVGIAGAAWLSRYLEGMLFGITQFDAGTYILAAVTFASIALLASYIPARRATVVDPLTALRSE